MNDIYPLIAYWCTPQTALRLKSATATTNGCISLSDVDKCLWRNFVCQNISETRLVCCATKGRRSKLIEFCIRKRHWSFFTCERIMKYIFTWDAMEIADSWYYFEKYTPMTSMWVLAVKNESINVMRRKSNHFLEWKNLVVSALENSQELGAIRWLLKHNLVSVGDLSFSTLGKLKCMKSK